MVAFFFTFIKIKLYFEISQLKMHFQLSGKTVWHFYAQQGCGYLLSVTVQVTCDLT